MHIVMAWLLVVLQGCSFIVTTLPDGPREPGNCTGHAAWSIAPAIDAAVIGAIGYGVSQVHKTSEDDDDGLSGLRDIGLAAGGVAIFVFASSAVKGILAITHCRCATKRAYDNANPDR